MADTIPPAFTVPLVEYTRLANERDDLRKELNDALASVDANWVSHQRLVCADRALQVERLKFDSAIKHLTAITGLLAPDHIKLPDGRVMEFSPPVESVMEYWRGLSTAIRAARDHVDAACSASTSGENES